MQELNNEEKQYIIKKISNDLEYNKNMILKDNKIISHKAVSFYNKNMINYTFKDSYLLIPNKLSDFNEMFKLGSINKEIIPYKLYTNENVNKRYININHVLENFIKDEDREHFINNIKKWNCLNKYDNDEYDILKYSYEYCLIDCIVLKKGLEIFNDWFINDYNENINFINIHNYLTLPSIAYEILIKFGCFDGVKLLSGVPSLFIQKCVIGGRTMTMNNNKIKCEYNKENKKYIEEHIINNKINSKVGIENYKYEKITKNNIISEKYIKQHDEKKYIVDFDAVSLYPSSMYSLPGFVIGCPKILSSNELNMNFLNSITYFYIEIQITKVNKNLKFPLQPYIYDGEQSKQYINDLENKKFIVDKITLEELINYQNIEFNIIRGYYFNEGFNDKIKNCIEYLFNKRLELKNNKNPAEVLYKLIMNSAYGKTILKPIMKQTKLFNNINDRDTYINNNFEYVDRIIELSNDSNKSIVVTHKHINDHFNAPQVGTMILSNSKKIMNRVFNISENNDINIFYQDTDSLHIYNDDLDKLINIYEKSYGLLVGKKMLNFHSDFKLDGAKKDIKASKSIFLGKKCYIDRLIGYDDNNNKIKGYHMRMKGVSEAAILDLVNKFNSNKEEYIIRRKYYSLKYKDLIKLKDNNYKLKPYDIYKILYNNESLKFDLLASGNKVSFDIQLNGNVHNRKEFIREIKFINGEMINLD